ncbi:uncharacterized protein LOC117399207 isoform X1 [Acipenser ruthenus]|uniref:uncharacterized protein LOC117399207 isoform X1 n=1 Tax=Acipenser ruthenus TaxID=7906 RepID=UPI00145B921C|nr:uncharacterized protein LOC117399207 isoform X1 [Acipenser ruthenus]
MSCYVESLRSHSYHLCVSMSGMLVEKMANYLLNAQIITRFECDVIKSKPVKLEKASELLSTIIRKGQRACLIFYQTLETCDPFLCERITGKTARTVHSVPVMTQTNSFPQIVQKETNTEVFSQKSGHSSSPSNCTIAIYNSKLSGCIFGSNNTLCIMRGGTHEDPEEYSNAYNNYGNKPKRFCMDFNSEIQQSLPVQKPAVPLLTRSIEIVTSDVEYVTAGNNNVLKVEVAEDQESEEEEPGRGD